MIRPTLSTHSQQAQPPRGSLPWSVVLPWGLTGAILVGTAVLAFLPRGVKSDQPPPGEPGALVWGDGLFTNALELQAWLRIRGVSYKTWAQRHPAGVKLLTPQPVPLARQPKVAAKPAAKSAATPAKPSAKRSVVVTPPRVTRAPAQSNARVDDSIVPSWLLPALLACAGLVALVLLRLRLPALWRWARVDEDGERRFRSIGGYAGLGLVAVGLGFLVPMLFG